MYITQEQMLRPNALAVVAPVAHRHTCRNWPKVQLPRNTRGDQDAARARARPDVAVSLGGHRSAPQPAPTSLLHFAPEAAFERSRCLQARLTAPLATSPVTCI